MLKIYLLFSLLLINVFCQDVDQQFCDEKITPDPENLPFPVQDSNLQYSVEIEKNKADEKYTEEIREYYDGKNNIGVSYNTFNGQTVKTYSYFYSDELLLIDGSGCLVRKISENLGTTPFFFSKMANGSLHIESLLTIIGKTSSTQVKFIGRKQVRGIPSKRWGACIFDDKSKSTMRILISYSDEEKWTPPTTVPGFKSIPLEVNVGYKKKDTGVITNEELFITHFRPNQLIDESILMTPEGVYCENRMNGKVFPKLPEHFSSWVQYSVPNNYSSYLEGSLRNIRIEHDFEKQLYRLDYFINSDRFTEVHDYNTGLKYTMNRYALTCKIDTIEDINNDNEPQTVAIFFETNQDPPYQYAGLRRVRGINTDVWIAPRKYNGDDCIWEWHFQTDQWVSQETNAVATNEPVLLNIFYPVNKVLGTQLRLQFHLTQFDKSRIDLYDFDISTCDRKILNKHLRFSLRTKPTDKLELVKSNLDSLKFAVATNLMSELQISFLRIGKLNVIKSTDQIYVVMTLFDKPKKYGPVSPPPEDDLETTYNKLKKEVQAGTFSFPFQVGTQYIQLNAVTDSFEDLSENSGRFQYKSVDANESLGYSSGSVAGFVIGFLLVGLLIGAVVGYFVVLKRAAPSLPGFLNPNFKAQP